MKLNHANLVVANVGATVDFFTRFFAFDTIFNKVGGFAVLSDGHGFTFNVMSGGTGEPPTYPANFHIGFFVDTPEQVIDKRAELAAAGFFPSPVQDFNRAGERTRTFYCTCPGEFMVEIAHSVAI